MILKALNGVTLEILLVQWKVINARASPMENMEKEQINYPGDGRG